MSTKQLIENRVRKGGNATESAAILADLTARHDGDNLALALWSEGFATERQAYKFIGGRA